MFDIDIRRFKAVVLGDMVYKIPVIGLMLSTERAKHPERFSEISEPYSSGNLTYINIPIKGDTDKVNRLAKYVVHSCGDSRAIF